MSRPLPLLLAFLAAGLLAGVIVVWSGVIPLAASEGHWKPTEWVLRHVKRRTIEAKAASIEVPPLDDPALVLKGGGHYESGCRPCHGAPGDPLPAVLRKMLPRPPALSSAAERWRPEELFWIVKHGIKLTGMPGWPVTRRDDEVWAMTAFLLAMPDMSADGYQRLVRGEPAPSSSLDALGPEAAPVPVVIAESCERCHGRAETHAFPILDGQSADYLYEALVAYAEGERMSGIMQPEAQRLSRNVMRQVADFYAKREKLRPPPLELSSDLLAEGAAIARQGVPAEKVPSCEDCHGPSASPRKSVYPRLAGQHRDYLVGQLELFSEEARGGSPYAHVMAPTARRLTPRQREAVASFYASLR